MHVSNGRFAKLMCMKIYNWLEVAVFALFATMVSAPFRLGWLVPNEAVQLPGGLNIFFYVLRGIGPLAGYWLVYYVLKSKVRRPNTFFGPSRPYSLIAVAIIPLGLAIAGVPNKGDLNEHYFGLIYGLMLVGYALGEEFGWRGYLQQALEPLPLALRIITLAAIWYVWHLNFLNPAVSWKTHLLHFFALVAGSWGLLKITSISRSLLFASAVHLSFNIFSDVRGDIVSRICILIVSVMVWVTLLRRYQRT